MRLWLNRTGEVSLREQLRTQVVLSILGGELLAAQRLPSVRDLARRHSIHANTVSAAYRQLEEEGWLEFRRGSGVFVRTTRPDGPLPPEFAAPLAADRLIGELLTRARTQGVTEQLLRARLQVWLAAEPPTRWLVIEPEPELRRILVFELEQALELPVSGCAPDACPKASVSAMPIAMPNRAEMVRAVLPPETVLHLLHIHPVGPSLSSYLPLPEGVLVAVASRWKEFHRIAHTMLAAAGLPAESLLARNPARSGWKQGLQQARAVVCDAATAAELPKSVRAIPYQLIAEASLRQLRQIEASLGGGESHPAKTEPPTL